MRRSLFLAAAAAVGVAIHKRNSQYRCVRRKNSEERALGKNINSVVRVSSRKDNLKRRLRRHLRKLGFQKSEDGVLQIQGSGKDAIRRIHSTQREDRLRSNKAFITRRAPKLFKHFASGQEIDPKRISPYLQRVSAGTLDGDLFRLASLTWSVPVSNGFGRRLRYLVRDGQNDKLIGLIAIGDPVFNLSVRDNLIGWDARQRSARLVNIMDAYVLGALPPYNALLGGKMVASLLRSREIYDDFARIYGNTTGIISKKQKKARLLVVMTSSSMGRSSVYNRLTLDGIKYLEPIGYTGGWGHFHIPDRLFVEFRNYLREIGHPYADMHRFGQGPNWRFRTTRAALTELGFRDDMLRHGIRREVFMCTLAANATKLLLTGKGRPDLSSLLKVHEVAELAVERWMVPRAERRPEYRNWTTSDLTELFGNQRRSIRSLIAKAG